MNLLPVKTCGLMSWPALGWRGGWGVSSGATLSGFRVQGREAGAGKQQGGEGEGGRRVVSPGRVITETQVKSTTEISMCKVLRLN